MLDALQRGWRLVPLFGLRIAPEGADSLVAPIWGDATLLSPHVVAEQVLSIKERLKDTPDLPPLERLAETNADSYIAVRRKYEHEADDRAREICNFLSACMILRGRKLQAFTLRGDLVMWWLRPGHVFSQDGNFSYNKSVSFHAELAIRPVVANVSQLRESWETGKPMPLDKSGNWDIHRETPIAKALMLNHSPFCKKLKSIANHLTETCAASSAATQIQMAVTALEMIFSTNEFKKLEELTCHFFRGEQQAEMIKQLFRARHLYVHQGDRSNTETAQRVSRDGLNIAWLLLDVAAVYADRFAENFANFLEYVRCEVELEQNVKRLQRLNIKTEALEMEITNTTRIPLPDLSIIKK